MRKLYLAAILVIILACYNSNVFADEKKASRKINVKDPISDFNTMRAGFAYMDVVAFFCNNVWSMLSPMFAGFSKVLAQAIYDT